jgi:hypothetical protein
VARTPSAAYKGRVRLGTLSAAVALVAILGAATSGYGRTASPVQLHLTVTTHLNGEQSTKEFTLGCDPMSGSLPLRESVCRDITHHRQAMLAPRRARSQCLGSPFMPVVQVTVAGGPTFTGSPNCTWPGGTTIAVYFDASRRDAAALRRDSARLRCEDNTAFFVSPTPYASINACRHGLWTAAAERQIRAAKAALPQLGSIFPADPGVVGCRIPAGGPVRHAFAGRCGVSLTGPPSAKLVHFVEAWSQGSRTWRHTWTVRRSTVIAEGGPIPPQLWR